MKKDAVYIVNMGQYKHGELNVKMKNPYTLNLLGIKTKNARSSRERRKRNERKNGRNNFKSS